MTINTIESTTRLAYRPDEVAGMTSLSLQSVYNLISEGRLRAIQPRGKGSRVLVTAQALSEFLGERSGQ